MTGESTQFLVRAPVPDPEIAALAVAGVAGRRDQAAVGAEGDAMNGALVAEQAVEFGAGGRVENGDVIRLLQSRILVAGGRDLPAIRAEGDAHDRATQVREMRLFDVGGRVP